jgi:hypothetical protein
LHRRRLPFLRAEAEYVAEAQHADELLASKDRIPAIKR